MIQAVKIYSLAIFITPCELIANVFLATSTIAMYLVFSESAYATQPTYHEGYIPAYNTCLLKRPIIMCLSKQIIFKITKEALI